MTLLPLVVGERERGEAGAGTGMRSGAGAGTGTGTGMGMGMDYTVHEAWNDATNVYLIAVLLSVGLLLNKRKIMRIFTVPPTGNMTPEPNFYDSLQTVRLRQQLDMYSIARKYEQQQGQLDSVQLTVE
ncbi:small integral membrane protein 19 isoform X2 [Pristis pectinata]|uniref:small integral membrane protein 19 isoform X2 n=1 Tax=Pristis pectinata TaxID=685728 RepID=UPI00223E0720|nr:small integral membrane protein 19 isoform X2 [Pristis pectinata]